MAAIVTRIATNLISGEVNMVTSKVFASYEEARNYIYDAFDNIADYTKYHATITGNKFGNIILNIVYENMSRQILYVATDKEN